MLRDERMLVVEVLSEGASSALAGMTIQEMSLPDTTLAAMIRRRGQLVVPHADTVIEQGDRLTILGSPRDIIDLRHRYDVRTPQPRRAGGEADGRAKRNEALDVGGDSQDLINDERRFRSTDG